MTRTRVWSRFAGAAALAGLLPSCSTSGPQVEGGPMTITVTSAAFQNGQPIPVKYTCQGDDVSPPLAWTGVPPAAKSLAVIGDDPDAPVGTWVHWVLFNLPAAAAGLPEHVPTTDTLEGGGTQGRNDFRKVGYGGPCPPPGKPHRYFFKVYALDAPVNLKAGATKADLLKAMDGHVLAQGQLMGTYQRR